MERFTRAKLHTSSDRSIDKLQAEINLEEVSMKRTTPNVIQTEKKPGWPPQLLPKQTIKHEVYSTMQKLNVFRLWPIWASLVVVSLPFTVILTRYEGLVDLKLNVGPGSGQITIDGRSLSNSDTSEKLLSDEKKAPHEVEPDQGRSD